MRVTDRHQRPQQWTLRQRFGRAAAATLVLLAALFATILVSLLRYNGKGNDVINRWQPAYAVSQDLLADLVNEETGLRGYALTQQRQFLQPYDEYVLLERQDETKLATLISGHPELVARFTAVRSAAERWRSSFVLPYIDRVTKNDPTVVQDVGTPQEKAAFDRIRAVSATLTADIRSVRESAKTSRLDALIYVWIALGGSAALILIAGLLLWRGLRQAVLRPVEDLALQTREVARGATETKIVGGGPPEIAALGQDVDAMRARIASELARVERARVVLVERSAELARSNADLEQFAYVASHDLSEPLRKVANFCQLLERQYSADLDDKAKLYINFAVDGAKRMQLLIGDLLSFSRVGRTTETFETVDTGDVVRRALSNVDERIVASGADITVGELPTVSGDPTLLVVLFQNLIGNALKYRSAERVPHISVHAEKRGDDWLFTIADNGIGIDPQFAERIFTIFQRLHLRDQYGGTGIGLALCRKIVEFHRGKIWLSDQSGQIGATFCFTIPDRRAPLDPLDVYEH